MATVISFVLLGGFISLISFSGAERVMMLLLVFFFGLFFYWLAWLVSSKKDRE
ncbi:hypothetical protein [Rosenbergiella australiborealis]|uniref:hypothetical protein n=1 Tax=Rosenbergiella australiborealis TaxID=1544696 RepID=UPI001BDA0733|nr:hypothetical protein [Rosenbergiella australiborealis]